MTTERREKAWAIVDQAFNSLSNLLGSMLAARVLSPAGFGAFAVAFSIYVLSLGVSRAWTSEAMVILHASDADTRQPIRQAAGTALLAGCIVGSLASLAGLLAGGSVRAVAIVLGISLPLLLLQDLWRFALVMTRRPRAACLNDLTWVLALAVGFPVLSAATHPSSATALTVWAVGGVLGAILGVAQLGAFPTVRVGSWLRAVRQLSVRFTGEFVLIAGSGYVILLGIAAVGDVTEAAAFRGAQLALAPLHILFLGASLQLLPQMVRTRESSPSEVLSLARRASIFLAGSAMLWGAVAFVAPAVFGTALVGSSWPDARPVVPFWVWYYVASGATIGATIGLRAFGAASASLRARLLINPLALLLGAIGFWFAETRGAVAGLALGATIGLPIWWRLLAVQSRQASLLATHGVQSPPEVVTK